MLRSIHGGLLLLFSLAALGQRAPVFHVQHYMPKDGLSNRHVTALIQDDIGFVWAGTVSGLDRFDGHFFRNWSVSDGLRSGRVDMLRKDTDGRVWVIATRTNEDVATIDIMDPWTGTLSPFGSNTDTLPFDPRSIVRIGPQRAHGKLTLGTAAPARCIIHHGDGRYTVHSLPGDRFEPLGDDRRGSIIGHLIAGAQQRIIKLDSLGHIQTVRDLEPGSRVEAMVSGRTTPGALYKVTHGSSPPAHYDTYSELQIEPPLRSATEHAFMDPVHKPMNLTPLPMHGLELENGRLVDKAGNVLFDLAHVHAEAGDRIKDCLVDRSGDPWLASEFGLFRIEVRGGAFQRLLYQQQMQDGIGVLCRGIACANGKVYLSTEWEGAYAWSPQGPDTAIEHLAHPQYLFAAHVAKDGSWWRGGVDTIVQRTADGNERSYAVPGKTWSILAGLPNGTLLGQLEGLCSLDPERGTWERWGDAHYPELDHAHVLQLERHSGEQVLITTSKGLYLLDAAAGRVLRRWWSGAQGVDRLPFDDLHHCYVDNEGLHWLSTRGSGLICYDPRTGMSQVYTMRNGFPNNMVYAAYEDSYGQLWLPTDGGIVRFDKRSRQSAVFTTADGITHDEFNRTAHARDESGRLYFGGLNGITSFHPDEMKRSSGLVKHPLLFTGFMCYSAEHGGMVDETARIARNGSIELDADDRAIRISFSLLSFEGVGRVLYAWRLLGVQDEWNYQHEADVRLDRLPYGDHVLEVKARDAMGQWSQHLLRLPIEVQRPWYAGQWPWVMMGALAMALTWWGTQRARRYWRRYARAARIAT